MKDIILLFSGVLLGALCSWYITHVYYIKGLKIQENGFLIEIQSLQKALNEKNKTDQAYLISQYIESAVTEWKKTGTPVHYLDSLVEIPNKQKAEIFHAASLIYKRREPNNNPYLSKEE